MWYMQYTWTNKDGQDAYKMYISKNNSKKTRRLHIVYTHNKLNKATRLHY